MGRHRVRKETDRIYRTWSNWSEAQTLRLAGKADVALMHPTCLWDSCAPEAVLKAAESVSDFLRLCVTVKARRENILDRRIYAERKDADASREMSETLRALFAKRRFFKDGSVKKWRSKAQAFDIGKLDQATLTDYLSDEILCSLSRKSAYSTTTRSDDVATSSNALFRTQ